ncbi:hypothetical protein SPICUR_07410 [Spiribacter curvatus]|uniref:NADH-ubiquinone oxidoreductase subunit 4L n=1 Tax=Spiribacter curvatus TaxID=1335757 RepID=U5T4Q5_9GAMM|nr:cation:proton antiporter subunit C [Spiribacter curvatus]AGY92445.1 hypothetical protein SPICUR_07410 [Spiribacter curvatus]
MTLISMVNYWAVIVLMMTGYYCMIVRGNMIKKVIGLGIFQTSVFILFISAGKVNGGSTPVLRDGVDLYSNPLPHVLILTAIVVGIATTAVALALTVRIREAYGSIDDDDIDAAAEEDDRV